LPKRFGLGNDAGTIGADAGDLLVNRDLVEQFGDLIPGNWTV
jgi:hypothetical protein